MTSVKKKVLIWFGATIVLVFILAVAWEFLIEEMIPTIINDHVETVENKWEFVFTSLAFAVIALIFPTGYLIKTLEKLQEAESQLIKNQAELIDQIHDAVISVDLKGNIVGWNKGAEYLLGYMAEEATGKYINFLYPDKEQKPFEELLNRLLKNNKHSEEVVRLRHKSGRVMYVQQLFFLVFDRNGKPFNVVSCSSDISKRMIAEIKIKQYAHELEESNRELQSFASIASHDLKEPLRKIIIFGDRLQPSIPNSDEKGHDYLRRMQKSASRMGSLVDGLLEFTRLEAKANPYETIDLNQVAQEVLEDLEGRILQTGGTVEIKSLPVLMADPLQMRQMFQNLIGSALKFHREDVAPLVQLDSSLQSDGMWKITVQDNGIGIDESHSEKIFLPFERLHPKDLFEGTGIGLSICKKIVVRHGGSIAIEGIPHAGTNFVITLPEKQSVPKVEEKSA